MDDGSSGAVSWLDVIQMDSRDNQTDTHRPEAEIRADVAIGLGDKSGKPLLMVVSDRLAAQALVGTRSAFLAVRPS
jgi:hypothetical protein